MKSPCKHLYGPGIPYCLGTIQDRYHVVYNPHAENPDDEIKIIDKLTGEEIPCKPTLGETITIDTATFTLPQSDKMSETAGELAADAMAAISTGASIDWAALRGENTYKIEIDFSKHPEVLQDLVEMAARDLRDPDKQALFILRSIYEKGIKISENFSND